MTDARRREAERHPQPAPIDEARVLVEHMRSGDLTWEDVALDAYLGHGPAQLAVGDPADPVALASSSDALLWLRGFAWWGPNVLKKAHVAWLTLSAGAPSEWTADTRVAFEFVERWCRTGDLERGQAGPGHSRAGMGNHAGACALDAMLGILGDTPTLVLLDHLTAWPVSEHVPALRALLRTWPLALQAVSALPGCGPIRERIVDAATSPERRRIVATLRENEGKAIALTVAGKEHLLPVIVEAGPAGFEFFMGRLAGTKRKLRFLLSEVLDARPTRTRLPPS